MPEIEVCLTMEQEDSLRHKSLKRYMENVLEDFDKRYTRLKDSHTSILQLIEQSSRLREGVSISPSSERKAY